MGATVPQPICHNPFAHTIGIYHTRAACHFTHSAYCSPPVCLNGFRYALLDVHAIVPEPGMVWEQWLMLRRGRGAELLVRWVFEGWGSRGWGRKEQGCVAGEVRGTCGDEVQSRWSGGVAHCQVHQCPYHFSYGHQHLIS